MRYLSENYLSESRDQNGEVCHISLHYPEEFNWAYDVVDDIAETEPDRPAMKWCNPEGEEHVFSFGDMKYWSDKTANFLADQGVQGAGVERIAAGLGRGLTRRGVGGVEGAHEAFGVAARRLIGAFAAGGQGSRRFDCCGRGVLGA